MSVPNSVYPLKKYDKIYSRFMWTKIFTLSDTGSMLTGEVAIVTGAAGVTATLYVKLASGSATAIWQGADLTYLSPG
jgi:NADPH-dependent curcumin reductase CurA